MKTRTETFTEALKREREARGWTQEQTAPHLGLTYSAYSKLEQRPDRKPSIRTALRAAELYGWSVSDLIAFGVLGPFGTLSNAA